MDLCFVNNNAPLDRKSQSLVRSHAMKGKNAGRVFRARGHKSRRRREEGTRPGQGITETTRAITVGGYRALLPKATCVDTDVTLVPNPFAGNELGYFPMPASLTPSIRYLFHECKRPHTMSVFYAWYQLNRFQYTMISL